MSSIKMGHIISFIKQLKENGYEEVDEKFGIFLDFESNNLEFAEASGSEKELSSKIEEKLNSSLELLEFLKNYGAGGKQTIQEASSKPGDCAVQDAAWNKMVPLVCTLLDLLRTEPDFGSRHEIVCMGYADYILQIRTLRTKSA